MPEKDDNQDNTRRTWQSRVVDSIADAETLLDTLENQGYQEKEMALMEKEGNREKIIIVRWRDHGEMAPHDAGKNPKGLVR